MLYRPESPFFSLDCTATTTVAALLPSTNSLRIFSFQREKNLSLADPFARIPISSLLRPLFYFHGPLVFTRNIFLLHPVYIYIRRHEMLERGGSYFTLLEAFFRGESEKVRDAGLKARRAELASTESNCHPPRCKLVRRVLFYFRILADG